jgi:hypothetical protein
MDDRFHVPKNTSVTIKRVPAATVIQMRYVLSEQRKRADREKLATEVRAAA